MPVALLPTTAPAWPKHLGAVPRSRSGNRLVYYVRPRKPPVSRSRADVVGNAAKVLKDLREALAVVRELEKPWNRQCCVCEARGFCKHRESELMEVHQR